MSSLRLQQAGRRPHGTTASTIAHPIPDTTPESHVLGGLRHVSNVVSAASFEGFLGQVNDNRVLLDDSIKSVYQLINDANRQVLRLEPDDEEGLRTAFDSYVKGSTFLVSSFLGHLIEPLVVPASFFGQWAFVVKYENDAPTVPWFVVAVAFAWARCVCRLWAAHPGNEHLALEVRTTLEELARHSGNTSLLEWLQRISDEDLRLSIDHLAVGRSPRNTVDQLLKATMDWASGQVAPFLPASATNELELIERSLLRVLKHLVNKAGLGVSDLSTLESEEAFSPDKFVGLEYIGPTRLVARMSPSLLVPTDETHAQALEQLHHRVFDEMKRSIEAPEAARETNELLAQHREDVWEGGIGMLPAAPIEHRIAFSELASSYRPSTLVGSLAAERSMDFAEETIKEEEEEGEHEDQWETQEGLPDSDDNLERILQERQRVRALQSSLGLKPATTIVEPLDFDDSRSAYAASSLGEFSMSLPLRAQSVAGSVASGGSLSIPIANAIASRSRDLGPSMIPIEEMTELIEYDNENRSLYNPSVLSGFTSPETMAVPTQQKTTNDPRGSESAYSASNFSGFSRARSNRSRRSSRIPKSSVLNEAQFSPVNEEQEEMGLDVSGSGTGVSTMELGGLSETAIAQWTAQATALTHEEDTILQEGAATAALMSDNADLGQRMSSHRAGESALALRLTEAHTELGRVSASLVAKDETIALLNQTLEEERDKHDRDMERIQHEEQVKEDLQKALELSRARLAETSSFLNEMQTESARDIEELKRLLSNKTSEALDLQRRGEELAEILVEKESQLDALTLELRQYNIQGQNLLQENEKWHGQAIQSSEEATKHKAVLEELQQTLHQLAETKQLLEIEGKRVARERDEMRAELEELQRTHTRETGIAQAKLYELSKQNNDLEDSLREVQAKVAVLERQATTDRERDERYAREKDSELLRAEELHRQMQTALEESQLETRETQQLIEQAQAAIPLLRRAVGMVDDDQAVSTSSLVDEIREMATALRTRKEQLDKEVQDAVSEVSRLADAVGVDHTPETLVTGLIQQILSKIEDIQRQQRDYTQATEATQQSLVDLVGEMKGQKNDPTIARMPSAELIRLAQAQFRNAGKWANDTRATIVELARMMGTERDVDGETLYDLLDHVKRKTIGLNKEIGELQRVLSVLAGVTVTTPSVELVRLAQERFRTLTESVQASSREVATLRRRIGPLEEQLEQERAARERERTSSRREIERCKEVIQQAETRLSQASSRGETGERELEQCRLRLLQSNTSLKKATEEKRLAEEMLSLREAEWKQLLQLANVDSERNEREMNALKDLIEQLRRESIERNATEANSQTENERRKEAFLRELEQKENQLHIIQQELNRLNDDHRQSQEDIARERLQWQEKINFFNRQLADARPGEAVTLRLERDQLSREVADLEARLQEHQQLQAERGRLAAHNEGLATQLQECRDIRVVQEQLVAELRRQVATLEEEAAAALVTAVESRFDEPQLLEDDFSGMTFSPPSTPQPTEHKERLKELGELVAQREYQLVNLEAKVLQYQDELANLELEVGDAEATLAELYETIASLHHGEPFLSLPSGQQLIEQSPPSPKALFEPISLDAWKERFPIVKPILNENPAKRWVLASDAAETKGVKYDPCLHDTLLDPRTHFAYREQMEDILRQTLAFVTTLGGTSLEKRQRRSQVFRGFDNLQRLAFRAKQNVHLDGFRLGTVCEFVIPHTNNIPYEGAVLQRYCELVMELAMTVTLQWRVSSMQQRLRLIFTERDLPVNDPTAVVVRFSVSPFQTFDRHRLIQSLIPNLVQAGVGKTLTVPVDANLPPWTPRERLVVEFEEVVPDCAPPTWIREQLEKACTLVPGLVPVLPEHTIDCMQKDLTYLRLARVDQGSGTNVLLVGQRDSWVVVDPLAPESDGVPQVVGCQIVGVIRAPSGVEHLRDSGFALMTLIREVFVHGIHVDEVHFRGPSDRLQCAFEHYMGCLFHP